MQKLKRYALLSRKKSDKKHFFKRFWKYFKKSLFSKKNLKRDLTIWLSVLAIVGLYFGLENFFANLTFYDTNLGDKIQDVAEKEKVNPVLSIQSQINTQNWKIYKNDWYGFELKYPEDLLKPPIIQKPSGEDKWEQKIVFNYSDSKEDNYFSGFEVLIYDTAKVKEISDTGEFPKLENPELISEKSCFTINNHLLEINTYPAEEIYIPASDNCYESALFFTSARDKYIYNIIPKEKVGGEEGFGIASDPQQKLIKDMPEFFAVMATWRLIDIYRPKPKPKPVVATAPMPVSYKKENGRLVCAKKNDKPGKSNQHKGKHMDMECCLDPDEYPNPHCYYDPAKYGKYLK